jgi:hypothetical protein
MGITSKTRGKTMMGTWDNLQYPDMVTRVQTTSLTAAQIKALYTTPIAIVTAPGALKVAAIVEVFAKYTFGTTAYTGSNNLEFRYGSAGGAKVSADIDAAFLLAASGTNYRSVKGVVTELTPLANSAVYIAVPSGNPAQGLGTMQVKVYYRTVTP